MKLEDVRRKRDVILELAQTHGAYNVRVFGSVARGEATASSDVDFLIALKPDKSLLDLGGFLMDLKALLACEVDVATEAMLKARMCERVLQEAVPL